MSERVRVLFVAGVGRSGSTLLERMLGSLDGFAAVGEVVHLNDRGVAEDQVCGCGERFSQCPFWKQVGDRAFGGWDQVDGRRQHELRRSVDRNRYLLHLLVPLGSYRRRLNSYLEYISSIYAAAADVTGADVVVDSSKHPSYAYLLRHARTLDLRIIHMVRRPHGVAHSWTKSVARPEITDRVELMPRYGPARVAMRWNSWNLLVALLRLLRVPMLMLRYEDLVADPVSSLRRIGDFAQVPLDHDALEAMRSSIDVTRPLHSVAGNPMRFERQAIRVRPDEGWREAMPQRTQRLVTLLTWPMRWAFGYRARSRPTVASPVASGRREVA